MSPPRTGSDGRTTSPAAPRLEGPLARNVDLRGQGAHDAILGTAHLGILNSPETWALVGDFLTALERGVGGPR